MQRSDDKSADRAGMGKIYKSHTLDLPPRLWVEGGLMDEVGALLSR